MTAPGGGPGVVVELSAAQDPGEPRSPEAALTESIAGALAAVPGLVRGLLLHPELPLAGALDPSLLTDGRLCWCTASEMRRLRGAGAVAAVVPPAGGVGDRTSGAAVRFADPGLPILPVDHAGGDPSSMAAAVAASLEGLAPPAPRALRIALSEAGTTMVSAALARHCDLTVLRGEGGGAPPVAWALDAWIVHLQGDGQDAALRAADHHRAAVVWLDDPAVAPEALARARGAVVPSDEAARRLALARGPDAPRLPVAVADPAEPEAAAAAIASLVAGLAEAVPPPR